jgi:acetyltransferase-like isoleucine patch superfamily enzyme
MRVRSRSLICYGARVRALRLRTKLLFGRDLKSLGARSFIERPGLLLGSENISIGTNTSIRWGARIEAQARFENRTPRLTIGDNVNIEQNVHIMCQSEISIGNNVSITPNCVIVDVTHPFDEFETSVKIGEQILDEDSFVVIGNGAFIGAGTSILPNTRVGNGAIIGANSVVTSDIPDFAIAAGNPARVIRLRRPPIR